MLLYVKVGVISLICPHLEKEKSFRLRPSFILESRKAKYSTEKERPGEL